jgi:hypothetical protein
MIEVRYLHKKVMDPDTTYLATTHIPTIRVLQYRTHTSIEDARHNDMYVKGISSWSDWQDVPEVVES